ncbi:MAG: CPBP family intramembrane glutamic endopeptidase [bacterium]
MQLPIFLTVFTLGYLIYLFSDRSKLLRKLAVRLGDKDECWQGTAADAGREWLIYLQKALGFVLLGVVPFLLLVVAESGSIFRAAENSGLTLPGGAGVLLWTLLPIGVVLAVTLLRSGKGIPLDFYPQVRRSEWNRRRILLNALFWILYLIGYEYVFRGYLLFPLVAELGLNSTVALNASLYALAHIYKGPGEAFGAFFLGIIFCLIALATGSFLIPLIMHIIMALGNDMTAVNLSHEMRFLSSSTRE